MFCDAMERNMTLNEYQDITSKTAIYVAAVDNIVPEELVDINHLLKLSYVGLGLGEAGEIQGKIKKLIRDGIPGDLDRQDKVYNDIAKELGDLLWYVAQTSYLIGYSLDRIAKMNIEKLFDRKDRGVLNGSGDDR